MSSNREKDALLSKARHNLKNPVNAILGFSEMLIEDCEDEGYDSIIPDLEKIHNAGKDILSIIESSFSDSNLKNSGDKISEIASEMEISLRTPINTVIGYSEMLQEDTEDIDLDTFSEDLEKIIKSGKALTKEIDNVISFNSSELGQDEDQSISAIKSVLSSIQPLGEDEDAMTTNGSILVVDDNKNNTTLLQKRLQKIGNKVEVANDGVEALKVVEKVELDLILLDIIMPNMNGYEVLEFLKKDKRFYEIPVIMLSSMDDLTSIYRCIELGADDYVTKPFDKTILEARISACIEKKHLRDKEKELLEEIRKERDKSDKFLLNILPKSIATRLKSGESVIADKHNEVSILFADIVEFTPQSKKLNPTELVSILNTIFSEFDDLSIEFGIEKIKTIGDNYFAVSGLNENSKEAAINLINMALEMIRSIVKINNESNLMELGIRIGIHSGPVVAGVIGKNKFAYDLWGSSVNMASRMESTGTKNQIQISGNTYNLVKDLYNFKKKEKVDIKGIGLTDTYYVIGEK
ncbi:MAG: adenylate cyclase [Candidatus Neomarinimicrobiota bacterium]|nr:MAG: adenylate cyclase [Candidatus Neomarinimicrobiota bacterium]